MKYVAEVKEVHCRIVEVDLPEGATKEQIADEVYKKDLDGYNSMDLEYSHTLDEDEWTIRDQNGKYIP